MSKPLRAIALAIALLASIAASASAYSGIDVTGPSSTSATGSNLTLTLGSFGTVASNLTLTITPVPGRQTCSGTQWLTIGTISAGLLQTPAWSTARPTLLFPSPWTVLVRCAAGVVDVDGSGQPIVTLGGVGFEIWFAPFSHPLASGTITGSLTTSGTTWTISSTTMTVSPGGSAASWRGSLTFSPALAYSLF